jgi:hypothetical protein
MAHELFEHSITLLPGQSGRNSVLERSRQPDQRHAFIKATRTPLT